MIGEDSKIEVMKLINNWSVLCPCGDSRMTETWRQAMAWIPVHLLTCHAAGAPSNAYVDIMPDMTGWNVTMEKLESMSNAIEDQRKAFPGMAAEMEELANVGRPEVPAEEENEDMLFLKLFKMDRVEPITKPFFNDDGTAKWPVRDYGRFTVKTPPTISPEMEARFMDPAVDVTLSFNPQDNTTLMELINANLYEGIYDDGL